mgnify:CR=1 FL=1
MLFRSAHEAVQILDRRGVTFEYDGEMAADIALDYAMMKEIYPFCRLTGPANVLVMPNLQAANIASKAIGWFSIISTPDILIAGGSKNILQGLKIRGFLRLCIRLLWNPPMHFNFFPREYVEAHTSPGNPKGFIPVSSGESTR